MVFLAEKMIDCNKFFTEHMLKDHCPTPDRHDALTLKRSENEQVDDAAERSKPSSFDPSPPSGPPQSYSSEVNQNLAWAEEHSQIESSLNTALDKEETNMANHVDPEACKVGLSDQGSRTRDVVHDASSDQDQACRSKDPVLLPNSHDLQKKPVMFPDSRSTEEGKLSTVSAEDSETHEGSSGHLKSENTNNYSKQPQNSYPTPFSDINSDVTATAVASEPPLKHGIKNPT